MKKFGTREEVINSLSKQTRGGLTKRFLKYNAEGKIISVRRRKQRGGVGEGSNPYSNSIYVSANKSKRYSSLMSSQNTNRIHKVATTKECIIFYQNGKNRYYFGNMLNIDSNSDYLAATISYAIYLKMLVKVIQHSTTNESQENMFVVFSNYSISPKPSHDIYYLTNQLICKNAYAGLTTPDLCINSQIQKNTTYEFNIFNSELTFLINRNITIPRNARSPYFSCYTQFTNTDEINKSIQEAVEELQSSKGGNPSSIQTGKRGGRFVMVGGRRRYLRK